MLASVNGRYTWPYVPALVAAAALFVMSGARVGADRTTRALDLIIIAALAYVGLQMLPIPVAIIRVISPATPDLQNAYSLVPLGASRPLSIHPAATREAWGLAGTAALVFWASRQAFAHGGSRAAGRVLAVVGFGCAIVSLAQRATAPSTVLWNWRLPDQRLTTFGFFVNRDHFATWLVLAISFTAGYLAMHVRAHLNARLRQGVHAAVVGLSDATSLLVFASITVMLLTLAATLSRSGFVALTAAAALGTSLARRNRSYGVCAGIGAAAALVLAAAWMNVEGLVQRVATTISTPATDPIGRLTIWRETLRLVHTFPIFGTGQGTFSDAMFVYQHTSRQVLFNQAHNEYLQIATEGGAVLLVVVVAGLVLLARTVRYRLMANDGSHQFVRIGACAAIAAAGVQGLWETGLRAPANLLLAAVLAGVAIADRRDGDSEITIA
jgi:O-antigen ligase